MIEASALAWLAALGAGLLIGIERERSQPPDSPAGLRSFTLAALAGTAAASIDTAILALVLAGFALLAFGSYVLTRSADPGLTTEFALILTVLIGALAVQSPGWAAGLAVVVAGILSAKNALHRFARDLLSAQEMEFGLLLAASALVVLPLLPDRPIAWLAGLNLHRLWLLAVLVMAIQSLGHIAVRFFGNQRGLALAGLAGGFISSTATIAGMAQRSGSAGGARREGLQAAFLSNVATVAELSVIVALIAPALLLHLWPAVALYTLGTLLSLGALRRMERGAQAPLDTVWPELASRHPFQPLQAVLFAAVLAVVLLVADWASHALGTQGALLAAGLGGFADAHAAAASAAQLAANGNLNDRQALAAIGIALAANGVSKVFAGFAGAQRSFGVANLLAQITLISLFWLGLGLVLG